MAAQPMRHMPSQETISCWRLQQLRDYWQGLRGARSMPTRGEVDPLDIPKLLPNIVLIDVVGDPPQFRYRLIGTRITEMAERDATGRWLDSDLYGDSLDRVLWDLRACVAQAAPVAVRQAVQFIPKDWLVIESVVLPFGQSATSIEVLMVGLDVVDQDVDVPPVGTTYVLDCELD